MNWFFQPNIAAGNCYLDGDEFRHCVKVLRKNTGDEINLIDGKGTYYKAIIKEILKNNCLFEIIHQSKESTRDYTIHIALAPTKNMERIEWFVEKAIEIGVDAISFVQCDHSERTRIKQERIDRIAISAIKQSGRATLPNFASFSNLSSFIESDTSSERFIAYVDNTNPDYLFKLAGQNKSYTVLIGPEGDFSTAELSHAIDKGYRKVSLGNHRLRTETAALAACHILNLVNT